MKCNCTINPTDIPGTACNYCGHTDIASCILCQLQEAVDNIQLKLEQLEGR